MDSGTTYQQAGESLTDAEACAAIRAGGLEMEQAVSFLYRKGLNKDQIFGFIRSRSGSREDAEDIFQEAMRSLILNIRSGKYRGDGSLQAYVFSICKNLWYKRFQKIKRESDLDQSQEPETRTMESPEALMVKQEEIQLIGKVLGRLGDRCRAVLELWRMGFSMQEIAVRVGYKGEHVARKKKSQCFRRLLDLLEAEPELLQILKEMKWKD